WRLGPRGIETSIEESRAKYATAGWLQQVAMFSTVFKGPGGRELAVDWTEGFTRWYLRARQAHFRILFRQVTGLLVVEVVAAVVLLGWGGLLVLNGQLSIGQLVASQLILTATLAAVAKFWKQLETAYDCLTAIDKVGYLVDLEVEAEAGDSPRPGSAQGAEVVIQGLSFEYAPGKPVLRDLDLHLRPGARAAMVSASSSGSTTLLDLLYGLREPTAGHVDVDGLDLRHWKRSVLRRHVGRVHGDDELFDGSIADNIRLGNDAVGLAEVREALDAVGLLPKVQAMRQGLHEPISLLGRSLSGTERRQVLLARAIVAQPRLLLLDATLDGFEPEEIDRILAYLRDGRRPWTLLVVTRDPDVIRRFDHRISLQPSSRLENPGESHGH
ncbi:MAG: ATP-binding cassette domain-containing protein, partial [Verrucomicrobiae bacterium]|nr:ATP-binding cassette domain-containing protein [Verrucomicrobiae bacterium]